VHDNIALGADIKRARVPATSPDGNPREGLRARKRRETLRRITDSGIRLFLQQGYEATSVDDVAAAAGVSRRTFFHYFESKDDILLSLQSGMGEMIADAVRAAPPGKRPLAAVREAVIAVCGTVPPDEMLAIDRLMRSSKTVQARKQASYIAHERTLFAALREHWPNAADEGALRLVAMMAIGAIRLSTDRFTETGGKRTLPDLLNETFETLRSELQPAP
jgi:AcrR family transcriptional regulator